MASTRFRVTFETITPDSAQDGEAEDRGWAHPGGWKFPVDDPGPHDLTLREALSVCGRGLEDSGRWFSTVDPDVDYQTGAETSYSLHPPDSVTASSYRRLARLLGC